MINDASIKAYLVRRGLYKDSTSIEGFRELYRCAIKRAYNPHKTLAMQVF